MRLWKKGENKNNNDNNSNNNNNKKQKMEGNKERTDKEGEFKENQSLVQVFCQRAISPRWRLDDWNRKNHGAVDSAWTCISFSNTESIFHRSKRSSFFSLSFFYHFLFFSCTLSKLPNVIFFFVIIIIIFFCLFLLICFVEFFFVCLLFFFKSC